MSSLIMAMGSKIIASSLQKYANAIKRYPSEGWVLRMYIYKKLKNTAAVAFIGWSALCAVIGLTMKHAAAIIANLPIQGLDSFQTKKLVAQTKRILKNVPTSTPLLVMGMR